MSFKNFLAGRWGIVIVGAAIGIIAPVLQKVGNPGNMGVCVACFLRDITGALGLHKAAVVQYMRPEIIGFVLGSLLAAHLFKEFRPRAGAGPLIRFVLGALAMIGALVFLGCPWRALLRLAGGDGNALFGLAGLTGGIWVGTLFLKSGYSLGRSKSIPVGLGWLMPVLMAILLAVLLLWPQAFFQSTKGPGSLHAPLVVSLAAGLFVGILAQRSRFCTMGAVRDLILFRQVHLFSGVVALVFSAFIMNLFLDQFRPGFAGQPVAHTMSTWNTGGMVLAGLAFTLAGGCPGRQLFLSGEGDVDAAVFVAGMVAGAAFAHNFGLASSPKGVGPYGPLAVALGLAVCLAIGFVMREKS